MWMGIKHEVEEISSTLQVEVRRAWHKGHWSPAKLYRNRALPSANVVQEVIDSSEDKWPLSISNWDRDVWVVTRWPWPHLSHPAPPSSLSPLSISPSLLSFPSFLLCVSSIPSLSLSLLLPSYGTVGVSGPVSTTREDQHPGQQWQTSHKNPTDFTVGWRLRGGRGLDARRLRWGHARAALWRPFYQVRLPGSDGQWVILAIPFLHGPFLTFSHIPVHHFLLRVWPGGSREAAKGSLRFRVCEFIFCALSPLAEYI